MKIEMLPAAFGDCLLVEYGERGAHRILIDGGLAMTYRDALAPRLARLGPSVALDLLVVTHIDRDHIRGILPLLRARPRPIAAADIWFNGYQHLSDDLGVEDGEALGELLHDARLPWNVAFGEHAVVVPDDGPLPEVSLPGKATLTLLSPRRAKLTALLEEWSDELGGWGDDDEDEVPAPAEPDDVLGKRPPLSSVAADDIDALADDDFDEDHTSPNGSSIAFILEHGRDRVLFAADAHPGELLQSLERYSPGRRVALDALKLSHHGSRKNLSTELLQKLDCRRYLISSDGSSYGHPDPETIARILRDGGERKGLYFNYASDYTTLWDEPTVKRRWNYEVHYPSRAGEGLVVEI